METLLHLVTRLNVRPLTGGITVCGASLFRHDFHLHTRFPLVEWGFH